MTVADIVPSIVGALECQRDSYRKTLETRVVACEEYVPPPVQPHGKAKKQKNQATDTPPAKTWLVEFEDSVLFPEGGGQPTDHGTLTPEGQDSPIPITNLQRHGLRCVAFSPQPVPPGTRVRQDVDFNRRWDHMQQHTGQHLLSAVMDTMENLETLGWGMGARGEMNYVELPRKPTDDEIRSIQERCNEAIRDSVPITVETPGNAKADSLPENYDQGKGVVRFIRISDLDYNACCGTHLKQTSHIGLILLHHTQGIRSTNCRLYFSCGDRAINLATSSINSLRSIAVSLSASTAPADVQSAVQRLAEKEADARKREKKLLAEIARYESDRINADLAAGSNGWCHRPTGDLDFIQQIVFEVKESAKESAVVLATGEEKGSGAVMIIGEKSAVETLAAKAKEAVSSLKGGGKGEKWQGKVTEWKKGEIEALRKAVQE